MIYRKAVAEDAFELADIFMTSFHEDIMQSLGGEPPSIFFITLFAFFIFVERDALIVAVEEGRPVGYIFIPTSLNKLVTKGLLGGYLLKLLFILLKWQGLNYRVVKGLLNDKLIFLRSHNKEVNARAQVLSIAVKGNYCGRGIAQELLRQGFCYLKEKGIPDVRLEVRPWNIPALRVYQKAGFIEKGFTKDSHGKWLILIKKIKYKSN